MIKRFLKWLRYCWLYIIRYHKLGSCGHHTVMFKPQQIMNGKYCTIGDYTYILGDFRLQCIDRYENQHFTPKVTIGDRCQISQGVQISCSSSVTIGNDVGIGPYSMINDSTHGHALNGVPFLQQDLRSKPIVIEDGTVLGFGTIVLPGVHIGKNCMIGAYSIIAKDIPDNTVVVNHSDLSMRDMKESR